MASKPIFGIFLTVLAYYLGLRLNKKFGHALANPLLLGVIFTTVVLKALGISYKAYMVGGSYFTLLISLSTVSLALSFYRNLDVFLKYKKAIIIGSATGSLVSMVSVLVLGRAMGLDRSLIISVLPKSVTTAIGAPLAQSFGGNYSLAAVTIAIVGIFGSLVFERFFKILRIRGVIEKGTALGTGAHAMGTSEAMNISGLAGAIAGVCIVIAGIITIILMPLILSFL